MSHAVIRGEPTAAQLYFDSVLDEIITAKGLPLSANLRTEVTISQVMFHCLKTNLSSTFMINGATGEVVTNEQLLKLAVPLARALSANGLKGMQSLVLMRNHQRQTAVYFASLFAGMRSFMIDPNTTAYELSHFLKLVEPRMIFCDREHCGLLQEALGAGPSPPVVVANEPGELEQYISGYEDDFQSYQVADSSPDNTVMYLPTSGSSGLPKAAMIIDRGIVMHLPSPWCYHSQFPTPTRLVMVLTTMQWITFTMMTTSCVANRIPLLLSPEKVTVEHVCLLLEKYRPTWTFTSPAFVSGLVPVVTKDQLSSLEKLTILGAPASPELMASIQEKLPKTAQLCDAYGSTETQGFMTHPDPEAPVNSIGRLLNIYGYKIVDESDRALGRNEAGELHVKGFTLIKGYYKNEKTTKETFTDDGWYKTGDVLRVDENERFFFVTKKKFTFKYKGCHVSPEEIERLINSLPEVHESVVCLSDNGPAALVVLRPSCQLARADVHKLVDSSLSDHKRLHGGVAFVESLPYTHSQKISRPGCVQLLDDLIKAGLCQ